MGGKDRQEKLIDRDEDGWIRMKGCFLSAEFLSSFPSSCPPLLSTLLTISVHVSVCVCVLLSDVFGLSV